MENENENSMTCENLLSYVLTNTSREVWPTHEQLGQGLPKY
jgi:hypothetical protein